MRFARADVSATERDQADQHDVGPRIFRWWNAGTIHGRWRWRRDRRCRIRGGRARRRSESGAMSSNMRLRLSKLMKLSAAAIAAIACCAQAPAQNRWVMDDNQFNQWVFNGNRETVDEESEVTLMVEAIDRSCHLTASQKEKLQLGARGDYARFKEE